MAKCHKLHRHPNTLFSFVNVFGFDHAQTNCVGASDQCGPGSNPGEEGTASALNKHPSAL